MLNVVTGPVNYPVAVLIRGVEGIVGPARLTKSLGITGHLNGRVANEQTGLWFGEGIRPTHVTTISQDRCGVCWSCLVFEALSLPTQNKILKLHHRWPSPGRVEHLFKSDGLQCDIDLPLPKEGASHP